MLQRQQPQTFDALGSDNEADQVITPSYVFELLKRRAFYFLIPFLLVLAVGSVITLLWPAVYLAEGKILVVSPEIPSTLVQPTVSTLANERISILEQRIMTRDNLLSLAKKYHLTAGWHGFVSGTALVDFIRNRTVITPVDVKLSGREQQAIAFNVGFEYEKPEIALRVANDLVTMILREDVRTRTSYAGETTRFMARDVQRIEDQLSGLDKQISEAVQRQAQAGETPDNAARLATAKTLASLKEQLAIKSATFSPEHPDIIALKLRIKKMEKLDAETNKTAATASPEKADKTSAETPKKAAPAAAGLAGLGLDTLETRRKSLQDQLTKATQKLAAARLGESLEVGLHSQRLEVIEQPSLPDQPISPNRHKIFALAAIGAMMAGGGLLFAAEMLDQSVRSSADLAPLVDSHLIISVPYITTRREIRRKKIKRILIIVILLSLVVTVVVAVHFFLPPPDVLYDKLVNKVMNLLLK
jgi:hypothetical protein